MTDNPDNEDTNDEFWIFHADDFQNKPIYRLSAPNNSSPLNIALTLHSTWMRDIIGNYHDSKCRQQIRRESVYEDYETRLKNASKSIHELFNDIVYD